MNEKSPWALKPKVEIHPLENPPSIDKPRSMSGGDGDNNDSRPFDTPSEIADITDKIEEETGALNTVRARLGLSPSSNSATIDALRERRRALEGGVDYLGHAGDTERRLALRILSLPSQYPNIADAYKHFSNDPELKKGTAPTYPLASGAHFDRTRKMLVVDTDPIAVGYFLHAIGNDNLRAIVSSMDQEGHAQVLQAILTGNRSALFDLLLPEDEEERLSRQDGSIFGSRERQRIQSLVNVVFSDLPESTKTMAISLGEEIEDAPIEHAKAIIRERFTQEAKKRIVQK